MFSKIVLYLIFFLLNNFCFSNNNEPIEITADKMEWNKTKNIAIAIGNAKAVQGNIIITANKIIANLINKKIADEIASLNAEGNVKFIGKNEIAKGNKAFYDLNKDIIILTGEVSLKKQNNIMIGEKLVIDFNTGVSKLEGQSERNKVKMRYNATPKEN